MKLVSLISSGIDSPVATFLMSKNVDEIILIHGDITPFTDKREKENFLDLARHLKKICKCKIQVQLIPHGKNLSAFKQKCDNKFTCVFCKRMLLRYAEVMTKKNNCDAILMGDSLGQVASQTLQNIKTIEQAVQIPVLRPLIGFDKQEVVKIAKEIGTYELSIKSSMDCSAVPNKPATQSKLEKIMEEEKLLDVKELVKMAISESKMVKL
jgi:thiamine biosynthesis protein ThiI